MEDACPLRMQPASFCNQEHVINCMGPTCQMNTSCQWQQPGPLRCIVSIQLDCNGAACGCERCRVDLDLISLAVCARCFVATAHNQRLIQDVTGVLFRMLNMMWNSRATTTCARSSARDGRPPICIVRGCFACVPACTA